MKKLFTPHTAFSATSAGKNYFFIIKTIQQYIRVPTPRSANMLFCFIDTRQQLIDFVGILRAGNRIGMGMNYHLRLGALCFHDPRRVQHEANA